jgi:hypothetical protein
MRLPFLAGVGIAVAVCGHVYANKPAPRPTRENLVGAWVAPGSWGHQYRLVFNHDGTGCLGEIGPNGEPFLFDVQAVEIDGYNIRVVVSSRTGDRSPIPLKGDGTSRSITLKGSRVFSRKTKFYPEKQMSEAINRLVSAMDQQLN